ncbi:hypothetical protein C8034_v009635 [Colletotrichum sidae]|uniref:Uncharacterized protein n=1 Tax=Colletotrichum sidae TaxID=1347389 RepID=A0A4R8T1M7_9PEZI|nr:hypothetical protein C8034_v009635 [Colletotrichum sidae]
MANAVHSFGTRRLCILLISLSHHLVLANASPTPDASTTLSATDRVLDKRVKITIPFFENDYIGRIEKGEWLKGLFPAAADVVPSPYDDPDDLEKWGWVPYVWRPPFTTKKPDFGNKLDEAFADTAFPVDMEQSALYNVVHEKEFTYKNGRKGQPTRGHYTNVAVARSGAFIFDSNFSPKYARVSNKAINPNKNPGDIPDLDTLSDLAWFQWHDSCMAIGASPGSLKVVFRSRITYVPTYDTVIEALRKAGHDRVPGWNQRITLSMDEDEGMAILGTAHGASTAWMLLQHKKDMGLKAIKEVVVWGSQGGFPLGASALASTLNLRFTIVDA